MGRMKRAEERERLLRSGLASTHMVILSWRTDNHGLRVDFLDERSRLPLCGGKVWHDKQTLVDLVNRTLTPLKPSPRTELFFQKLAEGRGEIYIELKPDHYAKLTRTENPSGR